MYEYMYLSTLILGLYISNAVLKCIPVDIWFTFTHFTNSHHGTDNGVPHVLITHMYNASRRTGQEADTASYALHHNILENVLLTGQVHPSRIETDCLQRQVDSCRKSGAFSSVFRRVLTIATGAY